MPHPSGVLDSNPTVSENDQSMSSKRVHHANAEKFAVTAKLLASSVSDVRSSVAIQMSLNHPRIMPTI